MEYHYVITAQRPAPGGAIDMGTISGTCTFTPGTTRAQALEFLFANFKSVRQWPPDEGNILFFDLAPNALA